MILDEVAEQHHVTNLNSKPDDIHYLTCHNQALTVLTVNVNHILAKRVELLQCLEDNSIDILIAYETKIDENTCDADLGLENF